MLEGLFAFENKGFVPVLFQGLKIPVRHGHCFSNWGPNRLLVVGKEQLLMLERTGPTEAWKAHPFFGDEQIRAHEELNTVHSIYRGPGNELWMGCGKSVCHYQMEKSTCWDRRGSPFDDWENFLIDREGTLWARSAHRLMSRAAAEKFTDRSSDTGDQRRKRTICR